MFQFLKTKILQIRRAAGLEINILPDDEICISGVIVKIEKNKVIKESEFHSLGEYAELRKKITASLPIAICISGKGILLKKLPVNSFSPVLFETILPNSNKNDFYFEVCQFDSVQAASICRKTLLEQIVARLAENQICALQVSIGPGDLKVIFPFLNQYSEKVLKTNSYKVVLSANKQVIDIESISGDDDLDSNKRLEYNIADQYIHSSSILAFGAAIRLIAEGLESIRGYSNKEIYSERENFKYATYFKSGFWSLLIAVFSLLIVNFIVYDYFFGKRNELQGYHNLTNAQVETTKIRQSLLDMKEAFIKKAGWGSASRISFFGDRIASMVPSDIILTSMIINPEQSNAIFEDGKIEFQNDSIELSGKCADPTELNRFRNNLRNIAEIKDILIVNYSFKKETDNGLFNMLITVNK